MSMNSAQTAVRLKHAEMSRLNDQAEGMKPTKKETFIQLIIPTYEPINLRDIQC